MQIKGVVTFTRGITLIGVVESLHQFFMSYLTTEIMDVNKFSVS